jgi:uncharacterized protein
MARSDMAEKYTQTVDRDSAYERLRAKADAAAKATAATEADESRRTQAEREFQNARRYDGDRPSSQPRSRSSRSDSLGETMVKSFARQIASKTGQAVIRGILGSLFKSR